MLSLKVSLMNFTSGFRQRINSRVISSQRQSKAKVDKVESKSTISSETQMKVIQLKKGSFSLVSLDLLVTCALQKAPWNLILSNKVRVQLYDKNLSISTLSRSSLLAAALTVLNPIFLKSLVRKNTLALYASASTCM